MNGIELYFLGQKLALIGIEALPESMALRRTTPGARIVLEDAFRNRGTSADEIAKRTGLQPSQVAALVQELSDDGLLKTSGQRIEVDLVKGRFGQATPIDEPLAAALRTDDAVKVVSFLESLTRQLGAEARQLNFADFDATYHDTAPWEIGRPQPALVELAEAGALRGRVLDVGCGTGDHALLAASLGLEVTGIDTASAAIEIARRRAAERNLSATFAVHDALDLGTLSGHFDTVIDSALFHNIAFPDRARYVSSLRQAITPGGQYFLLCFRDNKSWGRQVSRDEIEATFTDGWRIDAIDPVSMELKTGEAPAWRATITRL